MSGLDPANGRRPNRAAFILAAILAGLGILLIWQGRSIPDKGGYAGIGSGDLPVFIGGGLLILALLHVLDGLQHSAPDIAPQERAPVLFIVAGLGLQLILLHPLGFTIASALLFACTAAAFGKRNFAFTLPVGFCFAFLVYAVFDQVLKLNLPSGIVEKLVFGG